MNKLHDWIISSDTHLNMWFVVMWVGLALALALGLGCTLRFLLHPQWVTGIPSVLVFLAWFYLLMEGDKS